MPVKTIYNGGQGTSTLPCIFLNTENKKYRRWRVGAVRLWLRQHELVAATDKPAKTKPAKAVSLKRAKAQKSEQATEDEAWFRERVLHYENKLRAQGALD